MAGRWTFFVYMAGDNNLELFGQRDLQEMKTAGSTHDINVVAQFDRMSDGVSRRYHLHRWGALAADVVAELPETNTGDPAVLLDFIGWGLATYPAERTALILWNHGAGWKDEDVYRLAGEGLLTEADAPRSLVRSSGTSRAARSLFASSIRSLLSFPAEVRGILFDDSSKDFLDNRELKGVLEAVVSDRSGRRLDLIGFDACLMNMIEVAYQLRSTGIVMVGSQEIEPAEGWPYDRILQALAEEPHATAETLGRIIVDRYAEQHESRTDQGITQSSVRLDRVESLAELVGNLSDRLLESVHDSAFINGALLPALRNVQKFRDQQYVDLGHLARLLERSSTSRAVTDASASVARHMSGDEADSVIVTARRGGHEVREASGLSIYLPLTGMMSPLYSNLDFAEACTWPRFVSAFLAT